MTQVITQTSHTDMIHDAVLDYYGRRLATCSSDRTIKIFEIENETHRLTDTLKGHEAAVWCVSWAHPKFGNILASSSYDGRVLIWRENPSAGGGASNPSLSSANWSVVFTHAQHTASVNLLSWAPHECGCVLACASSDGMVSVLEFSNNSATAGQWDSKIFLAHGVGVNAVSWAPAYLPGAVERAATPGAQQTPTRRFATGGSDCLVKLWEWSSTGAAYETLCSLTGHTDWVRDVSWSPSVLGKTYIASASQDKSVRIWTLGAGQDASSESEWKCHVLKFECVVWRVSWSLSGNVLAVSGGDNRVTLWKERVRDGEWECVRTVEE